jgi:hypothetical protein
MTYPISTRLAALSVAATSPVPVAFIGYGNGFYWHGDIAEVVAFARDLSGPERHRVEEYLMRKYSTLASLPPVAPTFTPNGGRFADVVEVALATTTPGAVIHYTDDGTMPTAQSPVYSEPLTIRSTTTVRALAFDPVLQLWSTLAAATFLENTEFHPAALSGLRLWLRSDAGISREGAVVTQWLDQSDAGNHVNVAASQQSYRLPAMATDGDSVMPVVRFDGTHDHLQLSTRATDYQTVFWVLRNSATANHRAPMGDASAHVFLSEQDRRIWYSSNPTAVTSGKTQLNGQMVTGTVAKYPDANGPMAILSLVANGTVASQFVGYGNGFYWQGDIAEVVVYNRALSDVEVKNVSTYLAKKFKIQSPLLPW